MITKKEYQILRDWILENTCGCIYKTFTADDLRKRINEYKKRLKKNEKK